MFEKDFQSWFKENTPKEGLSENTTFTKQFVIDTWNGGYLAGFNKANEWHYVKDGDLPKETGLLMSKMLLLVTRMKGSDCLSLALGEYNFSTQEFSYQHIIGLTDVIAWKEIVLPELKEEAKQFLKGH
jgi:hypothetical protein